MRHDDVCILIDCCVAKVGMMKLFFPVGWSELAEKIDQVTSSVLEYIKFVVNVFFLIVLFLCASVGIVGFDRCAGGFVS